MIAVSVLGERLFDTGSGGPRMNDPAAVAATQSPAAAAGAPLLEISDLSVMLEMKGAKRAGTA